MVLDDLPTTLADLIVWGEAPSRNPYMAGFFKRKRSAARGNQITLREFTERYGRPFFTSSVLRRLSGIMGISRLTFSRCGSVPPAIYLDRMYVGNGVNPGVDDLLPVEWLGAVETYPRNAAPFELGLQDRPGTCGSIYLWTER